MKKSGQRSRQKSGWSKIKEFCRKASKRGYEYAWVDTCCIDKTSSAEFAEAINSMFDWYRKADVCYVYLADYEHGAEPEEQLPFCEWFGRGWTLQELIAPDNVWFYDEEWTYIGSKDDLCDLISRITSIPVPVLRGQEPHSDYSVAQRMSWAAYRETTRVEDTAYCLLGLFGINMPLLYGEREKAFFRLQQEILKSIYDQTIFAWDPAESRVFDTSILAGSPRNFKHSSQILTPDGCTYQCSMTSHGVHTDSTIMVGGSFGRATYYMLVGLEEESFKNIAVALEMVGPNRYERLPTTKLKRIDDAEKEKWIAKSDINVGAYLLARTPTSYWAHRSYIKASPELTLYSTSPMNLWDDSSRSFYHSGGVKAAVFRGSFAGEEVEIVLVITGIINHPKVCQKKFLGPKALKILEARERDGLIWDKMEADDPKLKEVRDSCLVEARGREFIVSATCTRPVLVQDNVWCDVTIWGSKTPISSTLAKTSREWVRDVTISVTERVFEGYPSVDRRSREWYLSRSDRSPSYSSTRPH